jgi:ribose 5-phosphate isomerase B
MNQTVAIGNDHAGTKLKFAVKAFLEEMGYPVLNFGADTEDSVDYPDHVHPLVNSINTDQLERGILICGSAQGVSMTANKYKNIRAAVCWKKEIAALTRQHNNANVLCLPARFLNEKEAKEIVKTFLQTRFEGGRHLKRIEKIGEPDLDRKLFNG